MIHLLAIDATAVIISAIGAFVSLAGLAMTLLIKKNVEDVRKDVDGKMTQLLEATGAKERAEGKAEGKSEQRSEAKEDSVTPKTSVVDVNIVDQDKAVKVVTENPKTKLK